MHEYIKASIVFSIGLISVIYKIYNYKKIKKQHIKEKYNNNFFMGQYYINKQGQTSTSDPGNNSPTDQEITDIVASTGLNPDDTIVGSITPD